MAYNLNSAAEAALEQVAGMTGLAKDKALGAALALAKNAPAADLKNANNGAEDADAVSGRDFIRIGILVALCVLLVAAVSVAFGEVRPRSISLQTAVDTCKASAEATGSKSCDPASLITAHQTDWQSSVLALLAVFFTPILTLGSASVGYYFANSRSTATKDSSS